MTRWWLGLAGLSLALALAAGLLASLGGAPPPDLPAACRAAPGARDLVMRDEAMEDCLYDAGASGRGVAFLVALGTLMVAPAILVTLYLVSIWAPLVRRRARPGPRTGPR